MSANKLSIAEYDLRRHGLNCDKCQAAAPCRFRSLMENMIGWLSRGKTRRKRARRQKQTAEEVTVTTCLDTAAT